MIATRAALVTDVALWRALRRDGIERYPSAFIATLDEHDAIPEKADADQIARGDRFLALDGQMPVGLAGLNRHGLPRARHRADVGPFYVIPAAQGSGAAAALMHALTDHARTLGIWQLELSVNEDNARAIAFYTQHGFTRIGRIPNAIIGAEGPEHDLMMVKALQRSQP